MFIEDKIDKVILSLYKEFQSQDKITLNTNQFSKSIDISSKEILFILEVIAKGEYIILTRTDASSTTIVEKGVYYEYLQNNRKRQIIDLYELVNEIQYFIEEPEVYKQFDPDNEYLQLQVYLLPRKKEIMYAHDFSTDKRRVTYLQRRIMALKHLERYGLIRPFGYSDDSINFIEMQFAMVRFKPKVLEEYFTNIQRNYKKIRDEEMAKVPKNYEIRLEHTVSRNLLVHMDGIIYKIAKPDSLSDNDVFISYLYKNPNKEILNSEISELMYRKESKQKINFDKKLQNLGFKNTLRDIFFKVNKDKIQLTNPQKINGIEHKKILEELEGKEFEI